MRIDTEAAAGLDSGAVQALVEGRHGDPFSILGPHEMGGRMVCSFCLNGAAARLICGAHAQGPLWWNGRRGRLKICCLQGRAGSSPARGTTASAD